MLIIKGSGPIAGTMAMGERWDNLFAAVPELIGAWSSASIAPGEVASWDAKYGNGVLFQSTQAYRPSAQVVGDEQVLSFGLGKSLGLNGALVSGRPLTVAIRAYLIDPAVDAQGLFGGSSSWRGRFRTSVGGRFDLDNSSGSLNRPMLSAGWYNILAVQGPTGLSLSVNDGPATTNSTTTGAAITHMAIGAAALNAQNENWRGHISRLAIATSPLAGPSLDTFRRWLNS